MRGISPCLTCIIIGSSAGKPCSGRVTVPSITWWQALKICYWNPLYCIHPIKLQHISGIGVKYSMPTRSNRVFYSQINPAETWTLVLEAHANSSKYIYICPSYFSFLLTDASLASLMLLFIMTINKMRKKKKQDQGPKKIRCWQL